MRSKPPARSIARPGTVMMAMLAASLLGADAVQAQEIRTGLDSETRLREVKDAVAKPRRMSVTLESVDVGNIQVEHGGGVAGVCPAEIVAHTDSNFGPGTYILQAGFATDEIAAFSYTVPAAHFPVTFDLAEMIFATSNANQTTTTRWSILFWEGTPNNGNLVGEFSSDGNILPHIVMPPGTSGINVQVAVDPDDEQIVFQDNGTQTFTVGYRIDMHHNPSVFPCLIPPASNANAFPTTDVSGLASPSGNWLFGLNCGAGGCPANGGWASFQQLPGFCTPSGDWVGRVTYTPFECPESEGACCTDTGCEILTAAECNVLEGIYQGDGTNCGDCAGLTVACCFEEGGGCLNLTEEQCGIAGGISQGFGTLCALIVCFPEGACCLPTGECLEALSPEDCAAQGGTFQGDGVICDNVVCPQGDGACCFPGGGCIILSEEDCGIASGTFGGGGTTCVDADDNGTPDACEKKEDCPADLSGNGIVGPEDLAAVLDAWGPNPGNPADLTGDGEVGPADLAALLDAWGACP